MEKVQGLYVHVPFCLSKCPYCDFYSLPLPDEEMLDRYTQAVCRSLAFWRTKTALPADTLYFGGGTPSLLGGKRLALIVERARALFRLADAEITLEANPADQLYETFAAFAAAGGNRLSMGMQAADGESLHRLGRRHTPAQLSHAVSDAHRAGLYNLSLDIMLATPAQTEQTLTEAVALGASLGASHMSAYLLKIEEGTPFARQRDTLALPDEEQAAALYLSACEQLERAGYHQYEISNFAKAGFESRHNLKYWNAAPYIGVGPSAHGFVNGTRWEYTRSVEAFLQGDAPYAEDPDAALADNGEEEYALLRLRLTDGLTEAAFAARFGKALPRAWRVHAEALPCTLVRVSGEGITLTREGFLLSNTLIAHILWG